MAADRFTFSEQDCQRIKAMLLAFERGEMNARPRYRRKDMPWRYPGLDVKLGRTDELIPGNLKAPVSGSYQQRQYYRGDVVVNEMSEYSLTDTPWNEMVSGGTLARQGYSSDTTTTHECLNLLSFTLPLNTYVLIAQIDGVWCILDVVGTYKPEVWCGLAGSTTINSLSTIEVGATGSAVISATAIAEDYAFAAVPTSGTTNCIKIMEQRQYQIGYNATVSWGTRQSGGSDLVQSMTIGLSMHDDNGSGTVPTPAFCKTYPSTSPSSVYGYRISVSASTAFRPVSGTYNFPILMKLTVNLDTTSNYSAYPEVSEGRMWLTTADFAAQTNDGRGNP